MIERINQEMQLRSSSDDISSDAELSLRIKHELLYEGRITDRDLLLEAVKPWG